MSRVLLRLAAAGASVSLLAGCTAGSGGSVAPDPEGMATFACALTAAVQDGAIDAGMGSASGSESVTPIPLTVDTLLGVGGGRPIGDFEQLAESASKLPAGVLSSDPELVDSGFEEVGSHCEALDLPYRDIDVSVDGQVDYGCTLAHHVRDADVSEEVWRELGQEHASLLTAEHSLIGLLTAPGVANNDKYRELSGDAQELLEARSTFNYDGTVRALDAIADRCS